MRDAKLGRSEVVEVRLGSRTRVYFDRTFFRLAGDRFLEVGAATPLAKAFC
jgi:hypothetical protein